MKTRHITKLINAHPASDGAGVKIHRIPGFNDTAFSPFLMIDEFKSTHRDDYIGGFPPHPHRGIETLTYMLEGHFQHRDSMGNVGELKAGGAQWMAAGRGVIHSEMPMMDRGALHGFQIWINQPARNKKQPAHYFELPSDQIVERTVTQQGTMRLLTGSVTIAGEQYQTGLRQSGVEATVLDWNGAKDELITLTLPNEFNVLLYVYQGEISIDGKSAKVGQLAQFSVGDVIQIESNMISGALLLAGQPINEPIVHHGPFVMNSLDEIEQAVNDYQTGKFEQYAVTSAKEPT
ncbi:pirin family protein [Vibrio sp. SM6]|uniref:Pirin family protein n=1 Tax=Vibrio agarilyticus TaxID=2726741 RepID=A0A7X8YIB8_9VIBR|nr:pirin family protein [Vibrio agarilyticus]NLS14411.1 pirin family protein [Vibrio agarilyticus]